MTTTETQNVGKLENLQSLELPVIEVNGRKELVVGINQHPFNQGSIYTIARKNSSTLTVRFYKYRGDGTIFEEFATDYEATSDISAFRRSFDFYDAKLRGGGL